MKMRRAYLYCGVAAGGILVALAAPAFAQAAPSADGQTHDSSQSAPAPGEVAPADIVVTAQRRTERLQDVPISAQVLAGDQLVRQNVTTLDSVSQIAPAVHINANGRSSEIYIRGIGSGQSQFFDQSVGIFIDDIYHGRSRFANAAFLDLERVEILRGPQTTFFGNNAIAGAFNIVTRRPGDQLDAWARALISPGGDSSRQFALEGAVGGPLTDTLGVRVAATYNGQNGWLDDTADGSRGPRERNLAGRATLRFRPTADLDITLKAEASRNRNQGGLYLQADNCPPPAPFAVAGFCNTILANHFPTGIDTGQFAASPGAGLSLDTQEYVASVNYRLGGHLLTSTTGFYGYDFNGNIDVDGTGLLLVHAQTPEHYHQFSQELRIASPDQGPVQYIAGAYFQSDRLRANTLQTFGFLTPTISGLPPFAGLVPFLPLGQEIDYLQHEKSYSVFAALTWHVTGRLSLTGSLRSSWVDKSYDWGLFYASAGQNYGGYTPLPANVANLPANLGLGVPGALAGARSDHAWMPAARIQYQFNPRVMAYASYTRGFKAGGFNGADNTGVAANLPFAPEHVDAYEAGLKTEWFNRTLLVNLALYRSEFTDLQVAINQLSPAGSFISLVRNAGASVSQGVELETNWVMSSHLRLGTVISYNDAHYVDYPNATATNAQQQAGLRVQDLSGRRTQYTPRWSGTVTGDYTTPVFGDHIFSAELSGIFSSNYYTLATIDPLSLRSGYLRLDGRLTLETGNHRWAFDVIARNLTDRDIVRFTANLPNSRGSLLRQVEQPRNIAFQARFRW